MKTRLLLTAALTMGAATSMLIPVEEANANACVLDADSDPTTEDWSPDFADGDGVNINLACGTTASTANVTRATAIG